MSARTGRSADTATETPAGPGAGGALEPGTSVGRYTIEGMLGAGGMGVVYSARDPELQRNIAIKVLRGDPAGTDLAARTRILREAQALARLDHPNIVAIHDVGTVDDQLFVAMQLVAGVSLASWIQAEPRTWREVRDVFLAAGRGLEAAHAVGIVHRDFKPANVMVDGARVVVLDFGLARHSDDVAIHTPEPTSFDVGLTGTGDLVGTPAYMAPEQLDGLPATARSDQWSFCVSLFEALFGARPFDGKNVAELHRAALRGPVMPAQTRRQVPRWLTALVLRGLRVDPEQRHASMGVLLRALARDPGRRRRRFALVGAVAIAGAGAAVLGLRARPEAPPCAGAASALAGVWDAAARGRMGAAFAATGKPFAADSFTRAAAALDGYAGRWTAMRVEACEATLLRGEQSPGLMDARMDCLDRRRDQLAAVVAALSDGVDAETAGAAVDAVTALPEVAACADRDALAARVRLPEDRETRAQVATLSARLDQAEALIATGKPSAAGGFADDVEAATRSTYAPLRARALLVHARQVSIVGAYERVRPIIEQGLEAAVAARDDDLAARAWLDLIDTRNSEGSWAQVIELALPARTALTRAGDSLASRVRLDSAVADALVRLSRYDEAGALFDRTIAAARALPAPNRGLALALTRSIAVFEMRRDNLGWHRRAEEARQATEAAWGPRHYEIIGPLVALANADTDAGRFDSAAALHERATAIADESVGREHRYMAMVLMNRGILESKRHHPREALALYEQALPVMERRLGLEHPELATVLLNMAETYAETGRLPEARAALDRAQRICEAHLPPDHPRFSFIHSALYSEAARENKWEEALTHAQAGLALMEKKVPTTSPRLLPSLSRVGEASAELHRFPESVAAYERALILVEANPVSPGWGAQIRFALAQALVFNHGDRKRARRLGEQAERGFAEAKDPERRGHVSEWLAKNR